MRRLIQNLTSKYIAAANRLRPAGTRRRIVVYVESFDDIAFWRQVLDEFEDDTRYFEIKLPGRNTLGKGKRLAMMNVLSNEQLGSEMLACVDADYDWLLQDATPNSRLLNHSPYVIHTYVYAIENYQCYAPGLHRAVVTATLNDRPTWDFVAFMQEYSRIIWPLFVWNIWGYRYDRYKGFTLMDFCGFVGFEKRMNTYHLEQELETLRRRVNQKVAWLQHRRPEAKKTYPVLRQQMLDLGLRPEDTYLYIQGHTLMENVILPLLTPLCLMLRKEREREIRELACHATQRQNELSSYQHSQVPIEEALKKSTAWMQSPQMKQVRADIQRAITQSTMTDSVSPS